MLITRFWFNKLHRFYTDIQKDDDFYKLIWIYFLLNQSAKESMYSTLTSAYEKKREHIYI